MPLYLCNARTGALSDEAKSQIAEDVTRIHCELTDAPPTFVHVFFFEQAVHLPLDGKSAFVLGSIRGGRSDATKAQLVEQIREAIHERAGIALNNVAALTSDTPASWVMEGGDVLPEPGEEQAWLLAHASKLAAANGEAP